MRVCIQKGSLVTAGKICFCIRPGSYVRIVKRTGIHILACRRDLSLIREDSAERLVEVNLQELITGFCEVVYILLEEYGASGVRGDDRNDSALDPAVSNRLFNLRCDIDKCRCRAVRLQIDLLFVDSHVSAFLIPSLYRICNYWLFRRLICDVRSGVSVFISLDDRFSHFLNSNCG